MWKFQTWLIFSRCCWRFWSIRLLIFLWCSYILVEMSFQLLIHLDDILDRYTTMCMDLCSSFSLFWSSSLFVWQLWQHISCWTRRTIIGSGLHSSLLLQLLFMCTSIPYITIMQRLGCLVFSRPAFTLATLLCFALVSARYVVSSLSIIQLVCSCDRYAYCGHTCICRSPVISFQRTFFPVTNSSSWLNCFLLDVLETTGAVGYIGSNLFVRRIFSNIKCDWVPNTAQERLLFIEFSALSSAYLLRE